MPYLQVDLDAKRNAALVARAVGVEPGTIVWGLLELWEMVWRTKSDIVGELVLDGCFGPNPKAREALVAYGFLAPADGGWRVRGAERYLRITEGQTKGGKKRSAGKRDSRGQFAAADGPADPAEAGEELDSPPAADHLLQQPPNQQSPNTNPPPTSSAESERPGPDGSFRTEEVGQMWGLFQQLRSDRDLPRELRPRGFDEWHAAAVSQFGPEPPCLAFARYLEDETFRPKGWPTAIFLSPNVWQQRIPVRKAVRL